MAVALETANKLASDKAEGGDDDEEEETEIESKQVCFFITTVKRMDRRRLGCLSRLSGL